MAKKAQTKSGYLIMLLSSLLLGLVGISLVFAPQEIATVLQFSIHPPFLSQLLGGLYFSLGVLNWMTKNSIVGGIYNRPIVITNLTQFLIGGLVIIKEVVLVKNDNILFLWIFGVFYWVFIFWFAHVLFNDPFKNSRIYFH